MDKNKVHDFIDRYERQMQQRECRFTARQLALFRMLARDWEVDPEDVPAALIEIALNRIQQIENIDTISTLN